MPDSTGTRSKDRTWKGVVVEADPDLESDKRLEPEYEFSNGRVFKADRAKRHPYNIED